MQDHTYEDYDAPGEAPSRMSRIRSAVSTVIGALVAMALLMALGIWFYRLGVRDAQNVPIIRAAAEPTKVRPDDPGGAVAPHQEVESYEVAEGEATAQAGAAVIAPPPPEPRPEDVPMAELEPQVEAQPEQIAEAPQQAVDPETGTDTESDPAPQAEDAQDGDGEQLALNETPEAPQEQPEVTGGTALAPARSPVARPRPADLAARMQAAVERDQQSVTDLAARAASSPIQIQLAADPNEAAMRKKWQQIQRANSDILRDRALAIQTTVSGGVTYYRLRVGPFRDGAEARAICEALKARGQDCLIARNS